MLNECVRMSVYVCVCTSIQGQSKLLTSGHFTYFVLRMQRKKVEDRSQNLPHGNSQTTAQRRSRSATRGGEGYSGYGSYGKQERVAGGSELNLLGMK